MKIKRLFSALVVTTMMFTNVAFAGQVSIDNSKAINMGKNNPTKLEQVTNTTNFDDNDIVRVIVELNEKPSLVQATEKGVKYSELSKESKEQIESELLDIQAKVQDEISNIGVKISYLNNFTTAFNGFSAQLKYGDIENIEQNTNVKKVYIANAYNRPICTPQMENSWEYIESHNVWQDYGYKGEGMVIAVVDSGIDPSHQDMKITDSEKVALDKTSTNNIINDNELSGKYYTEKVPYGYNYYDKNDIIKDLGPEASMHGMHVAGIAAANGKIHGVAPEAQVLAMKVFSNDPGFPSTFDDIYMKAMDDAVKLGADVVNLSLGSSSGFSMPDSAINQTVNMMVENGVICTMSSGNAGTIGLGYPGQPGGLPFRANPEYGTTGSPGVSYNSLSVASSQNIIELHTTQATIKLSDAQSTDKRMPEDTIIVETNGYNVQYLNNSTDAQIDLFDVLYDENKGESAVFYKLYQDTILDLRGFPVEPTIIPEVTYYDEQGNTTIFTAGDGPAKGNDVQIEGYGVDNWNDKDFFDEDEELELVYCPGVGNPEEYFDENGESLVEGKVALVERGALSFYDKTMNATAAGAIGIIVYDNGKGSTLYRNQGGWGIPFMLTTNEAGLALKEAVLNGNNMMTAKELECVTSEESGNLVDSTSWGVTPELELKPEITAPGGDILSTFNDDQYGMMSGTSMAAPHVAGGSALVLQYIKEKYPEISEEEKVVLAKHILMNTAEIVIDPYETPYSPRRQGAGRMQLEKAITTPVYVVAKDTQEAKIELKDFTTTNFEMELTAVNISDEDATYKVNANVLNDVVDIMYGTEYYDLSSYMLENVTITAPETITVPSGGTKDFTVKVDFSKGKVYVLDYDEVEVMVKFEEIIDNVNMFIEGFVTLDDPNGENPQLSIPYVGFYGDWTEPKIFDGIMNLGEEQYWGVSGFVNGDGEYIGFDPGKGYEGAKDRLAISPNNDGFNDVINLAYSLVRNAEEIQFNILDENKNLLRKISKESFMRKAYYYYGSGDYYEYSDSAEWDGNIKNQVAEDGLYYYQIKAKLHYDNADYQVINAPVYVDTIAPVITANYDKATGSLTWSGDDGEGVGISYYDIYVNGTSILEDEVILADQTEYEAEITGINNDDIIEIVAVDYAENASLVVPYDNSVPVIEIDSPQPFEEYNIETGNDVELSGIVVTDRELEELAVTNLSTTSSSAIEFNYNEELEGYEFNHTLVDVADGVNQISVLAKANNTMSIVRTIFVDTTLPEIEFTNIDDIKEVNTDTVVVNVAMTDNFPTLKLYVDGSQEFVSDEFDEMTSISPNSKEYTITLNLEDGENVFTFELIDALGNKATKILKINKTSDSGATTINDLVEKKVEITNPLPGNLKE